MHVTVGNFGRLHAPVADEAPPADSDTRVEEGQTELEVKVHERMHLAKLLLRIDNLLAFDTHLRSEFNIIDGVSTFSLKLV